MMWSWFRPRHCQVRRQAAPCLHDSLKARDPAFQFTLFNCFYQDVVEVATHATSPIPEESCSSDILNLVEVKYEPAAESFFRQVEIGIGPGTLQPGQQFTHQRLGCRVFCFVPPVFQPSEPWLEVFEDMAKVLRGFEVESLYCQWDVRALCKRYPFEQPKI